MDCEWSGWDKGSDVEQMMGMFLASVYEKSKEHQAKLERERKERKGQKRRKGRKGWGRNASSCLSSLRST